MHIHIVSTIEDYMHIHTHLQTHNTYTYSFNNRRLTMTISMTEHSYLFIIAKYGKQGYLPLANMIFLEHGVA